MKKNLMNYIYIYISRALIVLLALFTVFSTVGAFKVNADDTPTVTIIKETDDGTDKNFKFRIKAYKETTFGNEYIPVMMLNGTSGEADSRIIDIYEDDIGIPNYTFFANTSYYDCYNEYEYQLYLIAYGLGYQSGYHNHNTNEYNNLSIKEDFDAFCAAFKYIHDSLTFDSNEELNANEDGYYESKTNVDYKGGSYVLCSKRIYLDNPGIKTLYHLGSEAEDVLYVKIPPETESTTEYLDLSSDPRFTSVGGNVYEFTVKANDNTGVTIDIPVGYTYEIEEVEDSNYTLKSINDDGVFDVKGEMGNDSETFTFFNESKDEPTPVEPTPKVDKPKYNLPKTGIE